MPAPPSQGPALPPGPAPLLLHVFPTFTIGGAQVRLAALANRWGPRFRHAVIALDGREECAARFGPQVPFVCLPFPALDGPARFLAIRRCLGAIRPDMLVTSNWGAIEWAAANLLPPRIPHIHTEDGFGPEEASGQLRRRVLFRRLVLRWSTVVLPSLTLHHLAAEVWRLPPRRLRYIPNGLDLVRFAPEGPKPDFPISGDAPVIGTVARLRAEKNLARLLRACARLHQEGVAFRLLVVGGGPERDSLERLVVELGLADRVLFVGDQPDPAPAYRTMDVFALSSDTEQMPFSVLEAMASARPVAATDVGDVKAMLAPENAPFVVPKDDEALAGALRRLLADPALRLGIGAANRAKAEVEYDEVAMAEAYAALFAPRGAAAR